MSSFYASAGAIVENDKGEILMVQEGKDHVHETWDFPGGGWEDRESIIECVKREVLEETGYKIEITGFLGVYKELNQRDGTENISFRFTAEPVEKKFEEPPGKGEILDVKFIPKEKIPELDLRHENRKKVLEKYQEGESYSLDLLWNQLKLLD